MKKYIKKFESLNVADNHVIDNPFTSYIVGQGNLVCNEPNKKLKLEGGVISIVDALVVDIENWAYITFTDSLLSESITAYRYYQDDLVHSYIVDGYEYTEENLRCFITADKVKYYLVEHEGDQYSNDNTTVTVMDWGNYTVLNSEFEYVAGEYGRGRGVKRLTHSG